MGETPEVIIGQHRSVEELLGRKIADDATEGLPSGAFPYSRVVDSSRATTDVPRR